MKENKRGVTLIALVVTIVVLMILAAISIRALSGDSGIVNQAKKGKNSAEISEEKEIINISVAQAMENNVMGNLEKSKLQEKLNSNAGEGITEVIDSGDTLIVKFIEKNRYYEIENNENVEYVGNLKEKTLTIQCVDSTGKIISEKTYTILKNKYSIKTPQIEGYEAAEEKIEGEISENDTVQTLYYLIFKDDTTLVFTGLDESGNITTDETKIVSYMVGDGSDTRGNGLLEKTVEGILRLPETYKGKQVTTIGNNAFSVIHNMVRADIGDGIQRILYGAFLQNYMIDLVMGKNLNEIEGHTFWGCEKLKSVTFKNSKASYGLEFHNCDSWTEIKVDPSNTAYKVEDNVLYSADGKTLILCPKGRVGEFTIPNSVQIVESYAFEICLKITKVIIPDSVTTLKYSAFANCSMEEVAIGKNVINVDANVFINSTLKTLIIDSPTIVQKITSEIACGKIASNAEKIYINEEITTIASYITENYSIEITDKNGYIKYVKNN